MRTRAAGNTYLTPLDQNKQITKFAKMKKDITDADNEYREGILVLETLRKKQTKATEEVNRVSDLLVAAESVCADPPWVHNVATQKHHQEENRHGQDVAGKHLAF